jgi:hypothetical protein
MRVFNRLQLNFLIDSVWGAKLNRFNPNVQKDTLYATFVLDQTSQLTEKQASEFKSSVYTPLLAAKGNGD